MDADAERNAMLELAAMHYDTALNFIETSNYWRHISQHRLFFRNHLRILRMNATIYRTVVQSNVTSTRFSVYPFRPNGIMLNLDDLIGPVLIGSHNGVVALFSSDAGGTRLSIWNPVTSEFRHLTHIYDPPQNLENEVPLGIIRTVGFGRRNGDYIFYIFYHNALILTTYVPRTDSTQTHFLDQERFHLTGPICDVIINGVPYWRGANGPLHGANHNEAIYYPERRNGQIAFRVIDYPVVELGLEDFRQSRLQEFDGMLGFVDFWVIGQELTYSVVIRHGGGWHERIHHAIIFPPESWWITPYCERLELDANNILQLRVNAVITRRVGNYTPIILNHVNTLVFF